MQQTFFRRSFSSLLRSNVLKYESETGIPNVYDLKEELIRRMNYVEDAYHPPPLQGKTVVVTGASRGLGREIALGLSRNGANLALIARSMESQSHTSLSYALKDVEKEILTIHKSHPIYESKPPLLIPMDLTLSNEKDIQTCVESILNRFGRMDALILNASAISLLRHPPIQMYDKMMNMNVKSSYGLMYTSSPHLLKSEMGHVISISPPLSYLNKKWIHPHPIYTLSKFGMSVATLGMADPLKANTLWPSKLIRTAATSMIEKTTGIPSFTKGLKADHFVKATISLLKSNHCGSSFLDSDIVQVPDGGIDDIFL